MDSFFHLIIVIAQYILTFTKNKICLKSIYNSIKKLASAATLQA
jgi:hypothetical protein